MTLVSLADRPKTLAAAQREVLYPDRHPDTVTLPCNDCIHQKVCKHRAGLTTTVFEVLRPVGLPDNVVFSVNPDVDCIDFVASEEVLLMAGMEPEVPRWRKRGRDLLMALLGAAALAGIFLKASM